VKQNPGLIKTTNSNGLNLMAFQITTSNIIQTIMIQIKKIELKKILIVVILMVSYSISCTVSEKDDFKLATFSSDATPPIGHMLLTGHCKNVESIEAPLEVRGFVLLPPNEKPVVFCSVDWADIRNDAYIRWCNVLAEAAGTDPSRIMLCEVHQHDTPLADLEAQHILERFHSPYRMLDLDWHERVVQSVAAAIRKSLANPQTITHIGFGRGEVRKIASNRRYILPDGTPSYNRMSSCKDSIAQNAPEGDIDPFLRTLSFWNGGKAVCALSIYSTHPMSYYATGKADPDFPGLARTRRQADDTGIFQIYASGAAGNITAGKYNDGSHENRPVLADRLYQGMIEAWKNTIKQPLTSVTFRAAAVRFEPRQSKSYTREDLEKTLSIEGDAMKHTAAALGLSWLERVEKDGGSAIIEFPLVDLNNGQVNLLVLPAEIYIEYQLYAQKVNPASFVMTAGFGESAPGYIPIERAWSECDNNLDSWCWVAPGMEDRIKKALDGLLKP
jgi:hypothetical protein